MVTVGEAGPSVSDGDKGDITVSGSGTVWTVDNDAITYAKIQNVSATDKLLGRSTAGAGDVEEIACTAFARSILDDVDEAAFKATVNLEIGTDVQAYDATLLNAADIGVSVQAYDAQLADVAGLTPTDNGVVIGNGTNFVVESGATLKTSLGFSTPDDVIPSAAFASLPTASSVPGQMRIATDLNNALLRSDGTNWLPVNGSAVIANAHNVNLTVQSLTEALITSVAFPAGFVRARSRIRTWMRWALPGVGTAIRLWRQYEGAVGAGVGGGVAQSLSVAFSANKNEMEVVNVTTALGVNQATKQSTTSNIGIHNISTPTIDLAPIVNFGNAWEIAFAAQSCAETAQTAVTATWAAGVATFTKTTHGYAVGDKIVNTLFTPSGYNATFIVASVPDANSWTAALVADPGGAGSGGSTSRISNVTLVDYYVEWLQ